MKRNFILPVLLIFCFSFNCWGQDDSEIKESNKSDTVKVNKSDTMKINKFTTNLDLLFYLSHKEMNSYPDLKAVNIAQVSYLVKDTEIGLYFRQILDRLASGYLYYNHYLNISTDLFKYKSSSEMSTLARLLRPTPVFIFQNNSGRGLNRRFQTGLFFFPVRHFRPTLTFNAGVGCLYDWSSWEVNNRDRIEAFPAATKEKILFINSHSSLRKDMYMDFSEWRPTLFLTINYQMNDILSVGLFSSYQQSLVSPYKKEIKEVYPELKKVYPYTFSQLSVGAKVYKGLAVKCSFMLDYENNNLSMYSSSWEYSVIFGVSWNFSSKETIPVIFKSK